MEDRLRHVEFKQSGRDAVACPSLGTAALTALEHGHALFEAVQRLDLKGIVAKRKANPCAAGVTWVKIKNRMYSQMEGHGDLSIVGVSPTRSRDKGSQELCDVIFFFAHPECGAKRPGAGRDSGHPGEFTAWLFADRWSAA